MIYVFDVTGMLVAIEQPNLEEAKQIALRVNGEFVANHKGPMDESWVWFRGAFETWEGVYAAFPKVHDYPLIPGELNMVFAQETHERETHRSFGWPLSKEELEEHGRQFQQGAGLYALGTPKDLRFNTPEEEKVWLEQHIS